MKHDVDVPDDLLAQKRIADVAGDDVDSRCMRRTIEPAPRVEGIVLDQRSHASAELDEKFDEVRANKTIGSGYENTLFSNLHLSRRQ
jgi:hypothetical protein